MTPKTSKAIHTVAVGLATAIVSYLSGAIVVGGPMPAWRSLLIGASSAAASRIFGFVLVWLSKQ